MRKVYIFVVSIFLSVSVLAQFPLVGPYSQNFDLLGITNSSPTGGDLSIVNASLNGWYFSESGTNADITITAGTGSLSTGDTYNFGSAAAPDRTLGGLQSGALNPTIGFYFTNNTGSTITSLTITYTGEQWRLGTTARVDRLDFEYSSDATSLITGTWSNADALDFTAPVTTGLTGALDGNLSANRTVISSTISGLSITNTATFFIRWTDFDASGFEDGLGVDDLSLLASFTPASTDYYRSVTSGFWSTLSTWESSPDNSTWSAATSIPTSSANIITIRNGHTVTVAAPASADQLIIASGGLLEHFSGVFTIEDGSGDDIDIQTGGIFLLSSAATSPGFGAGSPIINVSTGGILRLSASGLTGIGVGINASNYVYQHQSILEWTLGAGFSFSTGGVIYFPNVNATTIPIFRTTNPTAISVGANSNTIINGVFECNGANVIWVNTGTKTFRNGIKGAGIMDGSASGKFIINGLTAELGGGLLTAPPAGLEIGTPTTVSMISNKTITGNVTLLNTNSLIELGNFNLTITGTISITQVSSYVKTNGTGKLTLTGIAAFPTGGKLFPIGLSTINPLYIFSGTTASYSARIVEPITPPIYNDLAAVLRTWYITSSVTSPNATISFGYSYPGDCGASYNNGGPVQVGQYVGGVWNIHESSLTPAIFPIVPGTFIVTPTTPISTFIGGGAEIPFVVANNGAILPLDYFITAHAQKINNAAAISWKVFDADNVRSFELQRSVNNGGYKTIATVNPIANQLDYSYTDANLQTGTNLYRIKVNRNAGGVRYSNTVAVINDTNGLLITSIAPNPVHGDAILTLSAAKKGVILFKLYNLSGAIVRQWQSNVAEGTNNIPVTTSGLPSGVYHLSASVGETKTGFRLVKQ